MYDKILTRVRLSLDLASEVVMLPGEIDTLSSSSSFVLLEFLYILYAEGRLQDAQFWFNRVGISFIWVCGSMVRLTSSSEMSA